ncbi:peripheral myelin protein 22-like [Haliotis rubra]|uniref:peripheral myelin protein 22-like n=1 Tax=Haliotis rubra TaxID=36100 RepID=UPI001EE5C30E|nr:peripheral myelin protein 22-like [Haliotis rubra]
MNKCCGKTSKLLKVSALVLFIALLLHLIGFASPFWSQRFNSNEGLWEACQAGICLSTASSPLLQTQDWFKAVQGVMIVSFITAVVTVVLTLVLLFAASMARSVPLIIATLTFAVATAVFILIGVTVYGVRASVLFEDLFGQGFEVGFAYILSVISIFGYFILALMLAADIDHKVNEEREADEGEADAENGESAEVEADEAETAMDEEEASTSSSINNRNSSMNPNNRDSSMNPNNPNNLSNSNSPNSPNND